MAEHKRDEIRKESFEKETSERKKMNQDIKLYWFDFGELYMAEADKVEKEMDDE